MLEVIYNDTFTNPSIIDNMSASYALIVDSTLYRYAEIFYKDFNSSKMLALWENSVHQNLELKTIDNTITYRKMLAPFCEKWTGRIRWSNRFWCHG